MGHLIQLSYDDLLPGEDGLDTGHLYRLIEFAKSGHRMAPVPVRTIDNKFVHIDGRHRLIYSYLTDRMPDFYLADHERDRILHSEFEYVDYRKLDEINRNIWGRWNRAEIVSKQLNAENYHEHFRNLRKRYAFLKDYETCMKHLNSAFAKPAF